MNLNKMSTISIVFFEEYELKQIYSECALEICLGI